MAIFSYDSKFSRVVMRISYGCYLNLLWFVFSLPVVTAGAATAALYAVALKIANNEEGSIGAQFLQAFKSNFKQATQIWLVLLALGAALGLDIYALQHIRVATSGALAIASTLNLAVVIAACIVYAIVLMYVFPLVAKVENTNFNMLRNSLLIGTRYLFCTICVFLIHAAMAFAIIAFFTPLIVFGEGLCAVLSSYLLLPVIRICTSEPEHDFV